MMMKRPPPTINPSLKLRTMDHHENDEDDKEDDDDDEDDTELYLSNHTQAMRRAYFICQGMYHDYDSIVSYRMAMATKDEQASCSLQEIGIPPLPTTTTVHQDDDDHQQQQQQQQQQHRQEALRLLWKKKRLQSSSRDSKTRSTTMNENELFLPVASASASASAASSTNTGAAGGATSMIAELDDIRRCPLAHDCNDFDNDNDDDDNDNEESLVNDFVHNTLHCGNQPCLIRGLDQTNFWRIMEQWGTGEKARRWFVAKLGPDRLLPIRRQQQQRQPSEPINDYNNNNNNNNNNSNLGSSSSSSSSSPAALLDPDGRAMECETVEMSLQKWICYLNACSVRRKSNNFNEPGAATASAAAATADADAADLYYLKDWHLEQWLEKDDGDGQQEEKKKNRDDDNKRAKNATSSSSSSSVPVGSHAAAADTDCSNTTRRSSTGKMIINKIDAQQQDCRRSSSCARTGAKLDYTIPDIFQHDLLNPFLHLVGAGDYRFVYWGPAHSRTDWHSDVLHSFSWSFNVYGTKEWTFGLPKHRQELDDEAPALLDENGSRNNSRSCSEGGDHCFVVRQSAGECMFVPATWKHQVVNLEETLSINRNWYVRSQLQLIFVVILSFQRDRAAAVESFGRTARTMQHKKHFHYVDYIYLNSRGFQYDILVSNISHSKQDYDGQSRFDVGMLVH
jgi:JmjC domain, hydroxylase